MTDEVEYRDDDELMAEYPTLYIRYNGYLERGGDEYDCFGEWLYHVHGIDDVWQEIQEKDTMSTDSDRPTDESGVGGSDEIPADVMTAYREACRLHDKLAHTIDWNEREQVYAALALATRVYRQELARWLGGYWSDYRV